MTLRGLPVLVCLLLALGICTSAHAWIADHDSGIRAAGGGGGSGSSAGGGSGGAGAAIGNAGNDRGGNGNGGGIDAGSDPSGATALQGAAQPYSLRAIYFRRDQFRTLADCLTAASSQRLPLEVCQ